MATSKSQSTGIEVTYKELIDEMCNVYQVRLGRSQSKKKQAQKDGKNEVTLTHMEFKGKCNACRCRGHKELTAKKKKNNGNGDRSGSSNKKVRFKGKCSNCGQRGHTEVNCWQKEENADKQPNNWKQTSDVNVPNVETVMVCLETDNFEEKYSKRPTNDDWRNLRDQAATIFEGQPSKNDEFIGLVTGLFNNEHDAAVEWMSYWTIQENLRELENGSNISAKSENWHS